ncbi:DUF427 domain-containing protein [Sphingomonas sp. 28-63-12]|uniref:DUF427 domain-containing protein n=1 Tax=Sphingomonas sp. 28-63-12 TaxID=1970434 RepID=UPI000BD85BBA|nr:MAG: hypothetical protein B7Y47_05305 [Sphingomonas sp. 28-63-12]
MRHPSPDLVRPGQESVWDYPRPAIAELTDVHLRILFDGRVLAETRHGVRTLETSHPPSYYFPPVDVDQAMLALAGGSASICEWKGQARYLDVVGPTRRANRVGWAYPAPTRAFACLTDHIAFYAGPMDACFVNGEKVTPQPGGFYGGWITSAVAGPFKGPPGTQFW